VHKIFSFAFIAITIPYVAFGDTINILMQEDNMDYSEFIKNASNVVPSQKQLRWFDMEFYAFIHFTVNTFTDLEWGTGKEDPSIFNPYKLDCDQWVDTIKSAGMKGMILTAKHHDGFCLWPSRYTEHSIKNSPYKSGKGDIVLEAAKACEKGGIKFGFYLSPWDRNCQYYGTDKYNDYFKAQLTELLTGYGPIFHVWFDNACQEGPDGKKQKYDFLEYFELIHKYQPDATIFNDKGPDVRWCGNEAGSPRVSEWAVVPKELVTYAQTQANGSLEEGSLDYLFNRDQNIGNFSNIKYSKGLCFCPSEYDMSIRKGWFYHEKEEPHSLERLFTTYLNTVGANACLNLNIPPNREGLFDIKDVQRCRELGDLIKSEFAYNIAREAVVEEIDLPSPTQKCIDITFKEEKLIKYVVLKEDISKGQRVETFLLCTSKDKIRPRYEGTTIGHKKICLINKKTDFLRIHIVAARGDVHLLPVEVY